MERLLRCAIAMVALAFGVSAQAQTPDTLSSIRTIQIAALGNGPQARAMQQRMIERLNKSGRLQAVAAPRTADAVLRGASNIWVTGKISLNPRSRSVSVTNYQGYLSVELAGKTGQTLWSYLATPSRFNMNSITYDLADQIAARLLSAVQGGSSGPASTVASAAGSHVSLRAAGATFAAPLYLKWFEASGEMVSYDAVGSEAGIQQLAAGKVDFAASDMPLTFEGTSAPSRVTQFATVLGGIVPIYNLPGVNRELDLTPEVLAGIYSGTIHKWNDPRILSTNHGVHLPNADIEVTHRSDGSGTTFVWTSYLSQVSPEWKASVGAGTHVTWPSGTGAQGNEGVAERVQKTSYAIGYVELTYAIQHGLTYAAVKNPAGRFIKADLDSITTAAAGAAPTAGPDSQLSILNAPGKTAYPISSFTWLLVPTEGLDPQKRAAIADLLNWMLTSGQKQCASLGYAPLPHEVVARELQALTVLK